MNRTSTVVKVPGLVFTRVDDDLVFLNPSRDDYIAVNGVGRAIWELLAEPMIVTDLVAKLGETFEGNPEQMTRQVLRFLRHLESQGMVTVV